ncbi:MULTISPECIES: hypothetical protein [Clostridium]|uniref:Uncharacterized protein n=1 Tax=Clostridium faecium TaxID=2762223 RepID=A0ABR8YPH6_9CLOT|nr:MULTISPECIES: hypothetical protein [Clostridium]MBD8045923.1 hypothetical protein [Clostridium faecium]MDU1348001.1 hypothetical protein [Clostridium argentinense]
MKMTDQEKIEFLDRTLRSLDRLCELHKKVRTLDYSLSKLYPIAIVENNIFYIFDLDTSNEKYEFKYLKQRNA